MQNVRRSAYLLNAVLAAACLFSVAWKPAPPPVFHGIGSTDVPAQLAGFISAGEVNLRPDVRAALSAGSVVYRSYRNENTADTANGMDFVLIGGTDRSALHDPRSCFIGAGWKISEDRTVTLPGAAGITARACRIGRDEDNTAYNVVYLYVVDGEVVHEVTRIRTEMLVSALIGKKNRPVYFLRFIQPVTSPEAVGEKEGQMLTFASEMWKALKGKV